VLLNDEQTLHALTMDQKRLTAYLNRPVPNDYVPAFGDRTESRSTEADV
jgi:hypothetical protein